MVTPRRFERPAYRLGICRSILLSYGVDRREQCRWARMRASKNRRGCTVTKIIVFLFCSAC